MGQVDARATGLTAGAFAFELSRPADSATRASRTSASAAARTLRQAAGRRLWGSRRRRDARRAERLQSSSISPRLSPLASATDGRSTPVDATRNALAVAQRPAEAGQRLLRREAAGAQAAAHE